MNTKTWQKYLFTLITGLSLLYTNSVQSQIIPDNTLGNENSKFTPSQIKDLIEGGAIRGNNLFHSFSEFNVNNNQQVYFTNPLGINNILTRVTGNNISNIFGTLGVNGNANLFLINPNGIIFGPNARLDVQGSFLASTAPSIKFADGNVFSAKDTSTTPLLTMSVPVGIQWGNNQSGDITNNGNLTVGNGQNLTLLGDNVTNTGNLTASGGKIQVLGNNINILNPSKIDVSAPNQGGVILIGGDYQGKGEINAQNTNIENGVNINADGLINGDGGKVIVWADKTTKFEGNITANGGEISGNGGFVEVSGKENLIFRGDVKTTALNGLSGTLLIDPTNIIIASGSGGNITDSNDNTTIYQSTLEGMSGNTNIALQANNNITINPLTNGILNLANGNGTITFTADADSNGVGNFQMETANTIKTNGRDISISGASLILGNIDTSFVKGGDIIAVVDVDAGGAIPDSGDATFTFTVSDKKSVENLDVQFSAAHTWDRDLTVNLTSPSGTTLKLF
ncbi:MAG TPA: filamentous hemagglutinin N-terminal domain-containing protein, partial [Allocoleopsis sp.]